MRKERDLTQRQLNALSFIVTYIENEGYSPTQNEVSIGVQMIESLDFDTKWKTFKPDAIGDILATLRDTGDLDWIAGRIRSIELTLKEVDKG